MYVARERVPYTETVTHCNSCELVFFAVQILEE